MATFVLRLRGSRPNLALDLTDEERDVMTRHAAHWAPYIESGQMVVFGPVLDETGSWGLGVVEASDEQELRTYADEDPAVTTGTGTIEVGSLLGGFVRGRPSSSADSGGSPAVR
jgi:uncharacterized protein